MKLLIVLSLIAVSAAQWDQFFSHFSNWYKPQANNYGPPANGGGGGGQNGPPDNPWWPQKTTSKEPPIVLSCGQTILGTMNLTETGTADAQSGQLPWQASVQIKNGTSGKWEHACGGAVIGKDFVLTAASCLDGKFDGSVRIETGIVDAPVPGFVRRKRNGYYPDYPGKDRPGLKYAQRFAKHPNFDKKTGRNDVAVIRLAQPLGIEESKGTINTVCLDKTVKEDEGDLVVAGWGLLSPENGVKPKLQVIRVGLSDNKKFPGDEQISWVLEKLTNASRDECQGDIGAPIVSWNDTSATAKLVGLLSSADGCTNDNPLRMVKIATLIDWINENSVPDYNSSQTGQPSSPASHPTQNYPTGEGGFNYSTYYSA